MNRINKYRLWSIEKNKYISFLDVIYTPASGQIYSHGGLNITQHYIMEQFTGLKDKNGVEIYERDICMYQENEHPNDESSLAKITFDDGSWSWEGEYLCDFQDLLVVIGNIHQNPDLLEQRK